ncbi:BlaI/MecI/CopY family transcriptional regulator [Sporosarcina sp. CAU 1771]
MNYSRLSDTEEELMIFIWQKNKSFKSNELLEFFNDHEGREWKPQTLTTFLSRLVDKGLLSIEKIGRSNIYSPKLTLKEYKQREAQSVLNTMYQGSVKNFLATLYDEEVPDDELKELKKWFSDK